MSCCSCYLVFMIPYIIFYSKSFLREPKVHKDTVEGHIKHRLSFQPVLKWSLKRQKGKRACELGEA